MAKEVTMPLSEYNSDLVNEYLKGHQDALSAAMSAFHGLITGRGDGCKLEHLFNNGEFIANDKARYTPEYFNEWMDGRMKAVIAAHSKK